MTSNVALEKKALLNRHCCSPAPPFSFLALPVALCGIPRPSATSSGFSLSRFSRRQKRGEERRGRKRRWRKGTNKAEGEEGSNKYRRLKKKRNQTQIGKKKINIDKFLKFVCRRSLESSIGCTYHTFVQFFLTRAHFVSIPISDFFFWWKKTVHAPR